MAERPLEHEVSQGGIMQRVDGDGTPHDVDQSILEDELDFCLSDWRRHIVKRRLTGHPVLPG
jgi:hypothetical protein